MQFNIINVAVHISDMIDDKCIHTFVNNLNLATNYEKAILWHKHITTWILAEYAPIQHPSQVYCLQNAITLV